MTPSLRAAMALCRRELIRFYRQKSRIAGVIGSPLVFWFLIGSGLSNSFRHPEGGEGMSYLEYFFPGTMTLILLFTSIFSTISIIEDRREGFLQSVIVSPMPRTSIVLGKLLGGTLLALGQALLLLLVTPWIGIHLTVLSFSLVVLVLFVLAFALTGLGFLIAWTMESTQGFHAIMNLFLIPLWLLSGSLFPPSGAAPWLSAVMRWNPLSYGIAALRGSLYFTDPAHPNESSSFALSAGVTVAFAVIMFTLSTLLVEKSERASS